MLECPRLHRNALRAAGVLCVALIMVGAGCSGGGENAEDSASIPDAAADSATRVGDSAGANAPATVTVPADTGLASAPGENNETKNYLDRIKFVTGPSEGDIIDEYVECHKGEAHTRVKLTVRPVTYGEKIKWSKALGSGNGHFYAKISVAEADCGDLGLKKGEVGYLWVGPTAGKGARKVQVYRAKNAGVDPTPVKTAANWKFCNTGPGQKPEAHLRAKDHCTGNAPNDTATGSTRPAMAPARPKEGDAQIQAVLMHNQGMWVSCASGCCQAQF